MFDDEAQNLLQPGLGAKAHQTPSLADIGVDCIKIAGRDGNSLRKRRSLEMVREIVSHVDRGCDTDEIMCIARKIREQPELCQDGHMCYYPEVLVKETRVQRKY